MIITCREYNNILLVDVWSYLRNNTLLVNMWSYLPKLQLKQTNLIDLQFLSNYAPFPKNWCRKLLTKEPRG